MAQPWEASHPDYKRCPKCKGTGTQVSKSRRDYWYPWFLQVREETGGAGCAFTVLHPDQD